MRPTVARLEVLAVNQQRLQMSGAGRGQQGGHRVGNRPGMQPGSGSLAAPGAQQGHHAVQQPELPGNSTTARTAALQPNQAVRQPHLVRSRKGVLPLLQLEQRRGLIAQGLLVLWVQLNGSVVVAQGL